MKITTETASSKKSYGDLSIVVRDRNGNIKYTHEQKVDSFNRQYWRFLHRYQTTQSYDNLPLTELDGTTTTSESYGIQSSDGGVNQYNGIVIGSGTSATTYDTVLMSSIIDHGIGVNQVHAQETTCEYDASTGITIVTRTFISMNDSSSTINVNEVGVCTNAFGTRTTKGDTFLLIRDVLSATVSFGFEETITVQYRLRIEHGNNNYSNMTMRRPFGIVRGTSLNQLTNATGNVVNVATSGMLFSTNEGNIRQGLIFGTSDAAFDRSQINVGALIPHGESSNQLFYHPVTNTGIEEDSSTNSCRWLFTRAVENRTSSPITIKEVALFSAFGQTAGSFMLHRKVLDTPVTVQASNVATFWWEFCYSLE